jgi:hypothetical protein
MLLVVYINSAPGRARTGISTPSHSPSPAPPSTPIPPIPPTPPLPPIPPHPPSPTTVAGVSPPRPEASPSSPAARTALLRSLPVAVLADPAPGRPSAGVVLSVAPLLGADPCPDTRVAKWLHVHVRPSVR